VFDKHLLFHNVLTSPCAIICVMSANVEIVPPAGELCRARAVHVERRAGRYSDSNMQRAEEREGKGRGRAIADWQDG
jgi:hypothetical protein